MDTITIALTPYNSNTIYERRCSLQCCFPVLLSASFLLITPFSARVCLVVDVASQTLQHMTRHFQAYTGKVRTMEWVPQNYPLYYARTDKKQLRRRN